MRRAPFARRRPAGFTILEMIIAATIALMIFGIGFYTITASQRVQSETTRSLRQAENARLFFDMLEHDLRSAYPGWFVADKLSMVEKNATAPTATPTKTSDALRFFSRVDYAKSAPDGVYLIRYFVAPNDSVGKVLNQVRREVWTGYITPGSNKFEELSVATYPDSLDSVSASVFDEVERLRVDFLIYHPETKTFEPALETNDLDPTLVPQATHLRIRLFLKDDGRGNQTDGGGVVLPRMYQKVLPLPGGFAK